MKKNIYGDQASQNILIPVQAISGTTPIVAKLNMQNMDRVALVLVTTSTVAGAWTIGASNDYQQPQGLANKQAASGAFGSITTLAEPTIAAVVSGGSTQAVQIPRFGWGAISVTFTPTSGAGNVSAFIMAKGTN
jgi:hypothetical protein